MKKEKAELLRLCLYVLTAMCYFSFSHLWPLGVKKIQIKHARPITLSVTHK